MTDHTLPCPVVRDLLPSYIEGLTEAETTAAVAAHLEGCAHCRAKYQAMKAPPQEKAPEVPEVDYLKTVRKKNHLKIFGAVVGVLLAVMAGIALKLFVIGSPVDPEGVAIFTAPVENGLEIEIASVASANAFTGWDIQEDEDSITITARSVLVSPWNQEGSTTIAIPLRPAVREVRFFDQVIWKDGISVSHYANRLFKAKTPYVGDPSAVNRLLSAMDMDDHTLALQTDTEPYGLTIALTHPLEPSREYVMEGSAYLILALVDNLGVVSWTDPSGTVREYTLEEVNAALPALVERYNAGHGTSWTAPASVKDWGSSTYRLQQLLCVTELN